MARIARKITCSNEDNISIVFQEDRFMPFLLESCDGIYMMENNVATSENTMTDGATYQGSTTKMRNIVLTLRDRPEDDHKANRSLLYTLFKSKSKGTFEYEEDGEKKTIDYYVESVNIDGEKRARQATVSLLCPDPFFVDTSDLIVMMAGWHAAWEFRHEFQDGGEPFGERIKERLKTIENTSAADYIGLTITINALGPVLNPSITRVESNETIKIGTSTAPLNMVLGDQVIITTHTNNKHVYIMRDGVQTEINNYLDDDSEYIQLRHGQNTLGYAADSGESYMSVTVAYRYRYVGV